MLSLDPETLDEVLDDLSEIAAAAGEPRAGRRLPPSSAIRLAAVDEAVAGRPAPRVAALEWLDPVFVGGHWVPEMIARAGGEDVLGGAGEKSRVVDLGARSPRRPRRCVVAMPCGLYVEEAAAQARDRARAAAPAGRPAGGRGRRRLVVLAAGTATRGRGRVARPSPAPGPAPEPRGIGHEDVFELSSAGR